MDQEVSRATWTGATLLALVGAIGLVIVVFGLGRVFAVNEINGISKKLVDDNVKELRQLNQSTTDMTDAAIFSMINRNGTAIKQVSVVTRNAGGSEVVTTYPFSDHLMIDVKNKLNQSAPGLLSYTATFNTDTSGTTSITVYAY